MTVPLSDVVESYRDIGGVPHLTREQVAERLGVSVGSVTEYGSRGKPIVVRGARGVIMRITLPRFRLGNGHLYALPDVEQFVARCRAAETGANRGVNAV